MLGRFFRALGSGADGEWVDTMATATKTKTAKAELSTPVLSKGGAPLRNDNAMRHGLRAGKLPHGCGWIMTLCNQFRRALESAVIEQRGELTLTDSMFVNSATKWERHGHLTLRWLRFNVDELNHDQKLAYSREVARASTERDKCIKSLNLDIREMQHDPPWFPPTFDNAAASAAPDSHATSTPAAADAT